MFWNIVSMIADELHVKKWTLEDLVERSGLSHTLLRYFLSEGRVYPFIIPTLAAGISKAFGTSGEFWLRLFEWNLALERLADAAEVYAAGVIERCDTMDQQLKE